MGTNRFIPESEYDDHLREIAADSERVKADWDFLQAHYDEFIAQYPDEWVAILNLELVGHAPNVFVLIEQLKDRGIRPGAAVFERLRTQPELHFHLLG